MGEQHASRSLGDGRALNSRGKPGLSVLTLRGAAWAGRTSSHGPTTSMTFPQRRSAGHPRPACPPAARSAVTVMTAVGGGYPWPGLGRGGSPLAKEKREQHEAPSLAHLRHFAGASRRTRWRRRPPGGRGGARTPETAGTRPRSPRSGSSSGQNGGARWQGSGCHGGAEKPPVAAS